MIPDAREVRLQPADRAVLEALVRAPTTEQRAALRARIVLLAAEGRATRWIARELGVMPRPPAATAAGPEGCLRERSATCMSSRSAVPAVAKDRSVRALVVV